ncbi:MAG: hypothetical protein RL605_859 [Actinomycetota bacterium]|jgi:hypothetical protein
MRVLAVAAIVVFTVFVAVFAGSANRADVRVLPRWLWVLLCLAATPIGGIAYLLFGRPVAVEAQPGASRLAPDDDPNFLRLIDERIQRERGELDD